MGGMLHAASSRLAVPGVKRFRHLLAALSLAYLAFVIYGSLVPLQFRSIPLDQAVADFANLPFLELGIESRADWVANLLLFVPLAFLWAGAMSHGRRPTAAALASLLVVLGCVALSLGIEFIQLFFPQRTVSQNDVFAESLGGVLGLLAWRSLGAKVFAWFEGWRHADHPADFAERAAWGYLVAIYAYNLLPLDLTLSAVELFHKWRDGKVFLIPFASLPSEPVAAIYALVSDSLLWSVLAFLWGVKRSAGRLGPWQIVFLSALLLEFLQLFVYSRVSDVTDLATAAVGGALGAWAARWTYSGARLVVASRDRNRQAWLAFMLAIGWFGVLGAVFWYPFNFDTGGLPLRERLGFLDRVPFATYYFGSEFRAATEVLHKILLFLPLGGLLAWWATCLSWKWRTWAAVSAFLIIPFGAIGIELGQVFLPEKIPDSTDAFLEMLGGVAGYVVARVFFARARPKPGRMVKRDYSGAEPRTAGKSSRLMNP